MYHIPTDFSCKSVALTVIRKYCELICAEALHFETENFLFLHKI